MLFIFSIFKLYIAIYIYKCFIFFIICSYNIKNDLKQLLLNVSVIFILSNTGFPLRFSRMSCEKQHGMYLKKNYALCLSILHCLIPCDTCTVPSLSLLAITILLQYIIHSYRNVCCVIVHYVYTYIGIFVR